MDGHTRKSVYCKKQDVLHKLKLDCLTSLKRDEPTKTINTDITRLIVSLLLFIIDNVEITL